MTGTRGGRLPDVPRAPIAYARFALSAVVLAATAGCRPTAGETLASRIAAAERYGPLDVGADYSSYTKLSVEPFRSRAHGDRWVDVYVPAAAVDAYLGTGDIPAGTVLVKTSFEDEAGRPTATPGPVFIMKKMPPGFAPGHGDWWYGFHYARPSGPMAAKLGGPVYWRTPSPRVAYCIECHDNYDRGLGGLAPSGILDR